MPLSSVNVIDKISEEYYDLTTAEKKAADYVLRHPRESQFLSIAELAEESGVEVELVVRNGKVAKSESINHNNTTSR